MDYKYGWIYQANIFFWTDKNISKNNGNMASK